MLSTVKSLRIILDTNGITEWLEGQSEAEDSLQLMEILITKQSTRLLRSTLGTSPSSTIRL